MSEQPRAYWLPVLHAHLPFVRHPEFADPIEERWLHEAVVECYLPLLEVIRGWRRDNVPFRLTLSLSPSLVAMLDDDLLRTRAHRYLVSRVELAGSEEFRTSAIPQQHIIAAFYRARLQRLLCLYEEIQQDITGALAIENRLGGLELITSTATHAFLPLLQSQPALVQLQLHLGVEAFERRFGVAPTGLWSPECGYYRGLDAAFVRERLNYFFIDAHAIADVDKGSQRGLIEPLRCPAGPAAFVRDPHTSREVWNAREGYPGDPAYREFHRDIGYDLDIEYIKPYIHESGLRLPTGLKYHAVTGRVALGDKQWYDPATAQKRVLEHAADFISKREAQVAKWNAEFKLDGPPVITSPFDAELFGHWWFEGPDWLDRVMRTMCALDSPIAPITGSEYLARHSDLQIESPGFSSWGEGGYGGVWLAEHNRWIYPLLYKAGDRLLNLAHGLRGYREPLLRRALNQIARELLLAQSSDWAFLITMETAPQYAEERTRDHLKAYNMLADQLEARQVDMDFVAAREAQYNLFSWLDITEWLAN